MRDPRKVPKKGDVIRLPGDYRDRKIAQVNDFVSLYGQDRGRDIPMSYCSLAMWPTLAKNAKIVSVAPDKRDGRVGGLRRRGVA